MSVNEKMTAIADAIREKTGDTELLNLDQMAEKVDEVYEAGNEDMLRAMWDTLQNGGARTSYVEIHKNTTWTKKYYKPIYDITTSSGWYQFGRATPISQRYKDKLFEEGQVIIKELEEEQNISLAFVATGNCTDAFVHPVFSEYNFIDISQVTSLAYTFYGGYLSGGATTVLLPKRIERLICSETTPFVTNTFQYASGYTYIGFEGVIGTSINLSWSKLVPESMKKAILCLKNYAGTDKEFVNSISFSDACWEALEADSTAPDGNTWQEYVTNTLGWLT